MFITEYAGARARRILTNIVDLLAAIPSLLFGIWGFLFLGAQIAPLSAFLADHFGWIPFFATDENANFTGSMLHRRHRRVADGAADHRRGRPGGVRPSAAGRRRRRALALGGTRWGMIRTVVLPYGKGGIVGASMLGLGRALGETIAVSLLLPQVPAVTRTNPRRTAGRPSRASSPTGPAATTSRCRA